MGNKQSEKFFGYYSLWGTHSMDKSLAKFGFHRDDITDVFMTHLHFDHCGGSVQWNKDKTGYEVAFKNAKFWTNEIIGNGQLNPMLEKKLRFYQKIFCQCKKADNFILFKRPETDFLQKSELDFGIFLLMVIPKK
jgi:glyoxylase-like metal-dependent hydrolase (beta-lactamase superfamily II)